MNASVLVVVSFGQNCSGAQFLPAGGSRHFPLGFLFTLFLIFLHLYSCLNSLCHIVSASLPYKPYHPMPYKLILQIDCLTFCIQ